MNDIANALRNVTATMQKAIDAGRHGRFMLNASRRSVQARSSEHVTTEQALCEGRSRRIDAHDLIEVLLAVADDIDPPFGEDTEPSESDRPGG